MLFYSRQLGGRERCARLVLHMCVIRLSSDHGYTVKEHEEGLHIEVVYNCFIIIPLDGVVIWQLYTLKIST